MSQAAAPRDRFGGITRRSAITPTSVNSSVIRAASPAATCSAMRTSAAMVIAARGSCGPQPGRSVGTASGYLGAVRAERHLGDQVVVAHPGQLPAGGHFPLPGGLVDAAGGYLGAASSGDLIRSRTCSGMPSWAARLRTAARCSRTSAGNRNSNSCLPNSCTGCSSAGTRRRNVAAERISANSTICIRRPSSRSLNGNRVSVPPVSPASERAATR